jgi:integrase
MTINLVPLFRKKKELYSDEDDVTILVRLFVDNKIINLSSGIKVKYGNWNPNWENTRKRNPITDRESNHIEKNLLLKTKEKEIKDIIFDIEKSGGIPTGDLIKTYLRTDKIQKKKKSLSDVHFIILLEKYYNWLKSEEYKILTQNSDSYIRSVIGSIKDLIRFSNIYEKREGIQLTTEDIDITFVTGLIKFCDKRGLQPSTIKKRIKVLVSFNKWVGEQTGIIYSVPIPKKIFTDVEKNIIFLTRDDIIKIDSFKEFDYENANALSNSTLRKNYEKHLSGGRIEIIKDYTPRLKKTESRNLTSYEVYKDVLLFLCGTGMRFGDLKNITIDSKEFDSKDRMKGEFMYQSEKTNRITRVPLNRLTHSIFNKYSSGKTRNDYLFPRTQKGNPISNSKFNKQIKEVCKIIGLNRGVKIPKYNLDKSIQEGTNKSVPLYDEISSHIGRKTFIREQIEIGTPPRTIMSMTGHKSQKVFDGYYEILKGDRMKNNSKVFSTTLIDDEKKDENGFTSHQKEQLKKCKSLYDIGTYDREMYMEEVRRITD